MTNARFDDKLSRWMKSVEIQPLADAGIGGHGQNAGHCGAQKGTTGIWGTLATRSSWRIRCAYPKHQR